MENGNERCCFGQFKKVILTISNVQGTFAAAAHLRSLGYRD